MEFLPIKYIISRLPSDQRNWWKTNREKKNPATHTDPSGIRFLEKHPIQGWKISADISQQNCILFISHNRMTMPLWILTAWTWEITTKTFTILLSLKERGKNKPPHTAYRIPLQSEHAPLLLPDFRLFPGREEEWGRSDSIWEAFALNFTPLSYT